MIPNNPYDFTTPATQFSTASNVSHPKTPCSKCGCTCRPFPWDQGLYRAQPLDFDSALCTQSNIPSADSVWFPQAVQPSPILETSLIPPVANTVPSSLAIPQLEIIPQRLYRPRGKEQHSSVWPISIDFRKTNGTPFTIREALDANYVCLNGRDDPINSIQQSPSIYARIEWPGYPAYKRQIRTTTWSKARRPITRAKLATEIAKALNDFITNASQANPNAEAEEWTVGPRGSAYITVENLAIVSFHKISRSSWQPVFCLI